MSRPCRCNGDPGEHHWSCDQSEEAVMLTGSRLPPTPLVVEGFDLEAMRQSWFERNSDDLEDWAAILAVALVEGDDQGYRERSVVRANPNGGKLVIDEPSRQAVIARLSSSDTGTRAKAKYLKRRAWVTSVLIAIHHAGFDVIPRRTR